MTFDTAFHLRLTETVVNDILVFILINKAVVVIIITNYCPDIIIRLNPQLGLSN